MKPELVRGNVRAYCPICRVPTTFEFQKPGGTGEFGSIVENRSHYFGGINFNKVVHQTLRCCVCRRPAVATVHCGDNYVSNTSKLGNFWPSSRPNEPIPENTPDYISRELREAESCIEAKAYRAAAAMLRSTAEKTLVANGAYSGDSDHPFRFYPIT